MQPCYNIASLLWSLAVVARYDDLWFFHHRQVPGWFKVVSQMVSDKLLPVIKSTIVALHKKLAEDQSRQLDIRQFITNLPCGCEFEDLSSGTRVISAWEHTSKQVFCYLLFWVRLDKNARYTAFNDAAPYSARKTFGKSTILWNYSIVDWGLSWLRITTENT